MSQALENAKKLYMRGIQDGEIQEVLQQYMGESYTQHSTGVPDEKEGFAAFFKDFFRRNPQREIRIVRAFQDGEYVFLHVHQNLNGGSTQWITADIFRADAQGRMVEHWDVIGAYPKNPKEQDPIFGDFALCDMEQGEQNKKILRRFLCDCMQSKDYTGFSDYVAEDMLQHNQDIGQGAQGYLDYIKTHDVSYDFVFHVMAEGNYAAAYSKVRMDGIAYALMDVFRFQDGRIVEHWDNKEVMPEKRDLTNLGKF